MASDTFDDREKPYDWLDRAYPYNLEEGDYAMGVQNFSRAISRISVSARAIMRQKTWDAQSNVLIELDVIPDSGYWSFSTQLAYLARYENRPAAAQRKRTPTWDLGNKGIETHAIVDVPDDIVSGALLSIHQDSRRSLLKGLCYNRLQVLCRNVDCENVPEEVESLQKMIADAYRGIMLGETHPGFDADGVTTKPQSGTMPRNDRPL